MMAMTGTDVRDLASDLRDRFETAQLFYLESYDVQPDGLSIVRPDEHERAVDVFQRLFDTLDAVPPALIDESERLRASKPEMFERWLDHGIGITGRHFMPENASQFLEALNNLVRAA
jgi:hypothetical protein